MNLNNIYYTYLNKNNIKFNKGHQTNDEIKDGNDTYKLEDGFFVINTEETYNHFIPIEISEKLLYIVKPIYNKLNTNEFNKYIVKCIPIKKKIYYFKYHYNNFIFNLLKNKYKILEIDDGGSLLYDIRLELYKSRELQILRDIIETYLNKYFNKTNIEYYNDKYTILERKESVSLYISF
jgi:hypothetical protein